MTGILSWHFSRKSILCQWQNVFEHQCICSFLKWRFYHKMNRFQHIFPATVSVLACSSVYKCTHDAYTHTHSHTQHLSHSHTRTHPSTLYIWLTFTKTLSYIVSTLFLSLSHTNAIKQMHTHTHSVHLSESHLLTLCLTHTLTFFSHTATHTHSSAHLLPKFANPLLPTIASQAPSLSLSCSL